MSTTATKRTLRDAIDDARAFRSLFAAGTFSRWEIAGSIRRHKPEVGDVEHVVEPVTGDADTGGLFAEPVNLFWRRLDDLVADGTLVKHVYGMTQTGAPLYRWGERYRGVDFRGGQHELWTANTLNWGAILTIRTGPAEFSQQLVTRLLARGMRQAKGYVWRCRPCPHCDRGDGVCKCCEGTGLDPVERLSVGDERHYFELCGVEWREPEARR